jgi:hypothetical protein
MRGLRSFADHQVRGHWLNDTHPLNPRRNGWTFASLVAATRLQRIFHPSSGPFPES